MSVRRRLGAAASVGRGALRSSSSRLASIASGFRHVPMGAWRAVLLGGLSLLLLVAAWIAWPLPADVASPGPVASLRIEDRHGLPLRETRAEDGSRGGWVPYADIDPDVIRAFLAAEDHHFFEHHGVDLRAVGRAAWTDLRAGHVVSGASTLTMQTARLLVPIPRTVAGKVRQALWALRLEAHLDKARIFELYLNRLPLGQGALGVSAAARLYFDASATDLSPGQAALLASLAHAPSRDNPLVAPEAAARRRDAVLRRMQAEGYLTPDEVARARQEPVLRAPRESRFLAPHFTTWLLEERSSASARSENAAETGVLRTTLDLELQTALESEVRHTVDMLKDRGGRDAAVVVLDNRTGGVLAWVGSPDFWADRDGQVDMVVSPRQPGSALKPFLYGTAFDRGVTPATVLPDVPHTWATATGPYSPQNYDRRFHGPVRARQALASSFNVPAVVLTDRLGVATLLNTLHEAGFDALDHSADFYGLGLALGNGEVTLLELADAYRGIARGGVWQPVHPLLDEAPTEAEPPRRFMSTGAATLVLDILSDPVARMPGFGTETPFDFPFPAAAKTGTSRHFTDNWAVATTAGFTVAVWVGNFNGQPMDGVSGVSGAGPLLYRAVLQTAKRYAPGVLPTPEQAGAMAEPVCRLSGMLATRDCPSMIEWFLPGTEPLQPDDWQKGGRTVLPAEYADWERAANPEGPAVTFAARSDAATQATTTARPDAATPAAETATLADAAAASNTNPRPDAAATTPPPDPDAFAPYTLVSPQDGDEYSVPPGVEGRYATIPLTAVGRRPDEPATWYVDGKRVRGPRWRLVSGRHRFRVVWKSGRSATARVVVR